MCEEPRKIFQLQEIQSMFNLTISLNRSFAASNLDVSCLTSIFNLSKNENAAHKKTV